MNIFGIENCQAYCRIAIKALENIRKGDRYALRSFVLIQGRTIVMLGQLEKRPDKEIQEGINIWRDYAEKLTYGEFMQIYPISKEYDGHGEWKDYFSVRKYLDENKIDPDEIIGENLLYFVAEYCSLETDFIFVEFMQMVNHMQRERYGFDVLDELLDEVSEDEIIPKDSKGNLIGVVDGKVVKKPRDESFSSYSKTKNDKSNAVNYLKVVK